jgi:diaminopimelate decarboxylase
MTIVLPQHAAHPWFEVRNDVLTVAGRALRDIMLQYGAHPGYVYDRSVMQRKVSELRHILPPTIRLHYAMKANPHPAVVAHMQGLVDGCDVASAGEMDVALASGFAAHRISFAGPGKRHAELVRAAAAGVTLNVESRRELTILASLARGSGLRARVAVRVNPDFELKSSGMKMSGGAKPFGIDAEDVPEVLREIGTLPLEFAGLHVFAGSQNLKADAIVEAQRRSLALAIELARHAPVPPPVLNLGGGFGIPLFPGDQPLDLAPIAANLREVAAIAARELPQTELVLELGRYLVGEAGIYACQVLERKVSRGQVFLITTGGMHQHLSASGNFGQVLRKNYPVLIADKVTGTQREIVSVVGPLCTPLDLLADRMEMARAEPGDWVAVLQSGAYGFTASPRSFLSHPEPVEIVV